jgi:hypothetical protein
MIEYIEQIDTNLQFRLIPEKDPGGFGNVEILRGSQIEFICSGLTDAEVDILPSDSIAIRRSEELNMADVVGIGSAPGINCRRARMGMDFNRAIVKRVHSLITDARGYATDSAVSVRPVWRQDGVCDSH